MLKVYKAYQVSGSKIPLPAGCHLCTSSRCKRHIHLNKLNYSLIRRSKKKDKQKVGEERPPADGLIIIIYVLVKFKKFKIENEIKCAFNELL